MEYSKNNTSQLDSYSTMIEILASHHEIVNKIPKFQQAVDQLKTVQNKLIDLYATFMKNIENVENLRKTNKTELAKTAFPIITILQIYAQDKKKTKLHKRLEILTPEYLTNCSDYELISSARKLWRITNKYEETSLAIFAKMKSLINGDKLKALHKLEKEYGLIPDMIKAFEDANNRFIESLVLYDERLAEKNKSLVKIEKLNILINKLFESKIDKFVRLFETQNPDLYENYFKAKGNTFNYAIENTKNEDKTDLKEVKPTNKDQYKGEKKVKTENITKELEIKEVAESEIS